MAGRLRGTALLALVLALFCSLLPSTLQPTAQAAVGDVGDRFYTAPTASSAPQMITLGPDDNLWFAEGNTSANKIGRITPAGAITEFAAGGSQPTTIVTGPDGNLWYTLQGSDQIGKMTPNGTFSGTRNVGSAPWGITVGPDNALWFTERLGHRIGRIDTSFNVTYPGNNTVSADPWHITTGPDGNLWFALGSDKIGTITPGGTVTEYTISGCTSCNPVGIVAGPDGNLWFTEYSGAAVGKMNTSGGGVVHYSTPTGGSGPHTIAVGPDGNLWFTEATANKVGRVTTDGTITEFSLAGSGGSSALGITAGPDGNVWAAQQVGDRIVRVEVAPRTTYSAAVQADAPRGYWRLGEGSGSYAGDQAGRSMTGTYVGGTTLAQVGGLVGEADTAAAFDGSTGYVTVPDSTYLRFPSTAFSLEAWIYPSTTNANQVVIAKGHGNQSSDDEYILLTNRTGTTNALSLWLNGAWRDSTSNAVTPQTWNHVVTTFDGSNVVFYVNGVQVGTANSIGGWYATTQTHALSIGRQGDTFGGNKFTGRIDEVAIYPSVLSSSRVQAHYQIGQPKSTLGSAPQFGTGAPQSVDIGATTTLDTTDGTIEAWIRPDWNDVSPTNPAIMASRSGPTRYSLHMEGGRNGLLLWNNGTLISFPYSFAQGTWYHVAVTFSATGPTMKAYVNGAQIGTTQSYNVATGVTNQPFHIGSSTGSGEQFTGGIDEVRVWNSARSAADIRARAAQKLTGRENGLIGYWRLDEGTGRSAVDSSASGLAATITGEPRWGPGAPVTPYGNQVTQDMPAAYWRLGGNNVVTMDDSSGAGRTGAIFGGVTLNQPGALTTETDTAAAFDGSSGYVGLASHSSLSFSGHPFSLEAWVYPATLGANQTIVSKGDGSFVATSDEYILQTNRSGSNEVSLFLNGAWRDSPSNAVAVGKWNHVVSVYDGTNVRFYVNGALIGTVASIGGGYATVASHDVAIGRQGDVCACNYFNGKIDEVAIYRTALPATRIAQHYRAATSAYAKTVLDDAPAGYWPQSEANAAAPATDLSGATGLRGGTWAAQSTGTANHFAGVAAVDANTAWAVGDSNTVRKTRDGGVTWASQDPGFGSYNVRGVAVVNANTLWVVGGNGKIARSTDGGTTWTQQTSPTSTTTLQSIAMVDASVGWIVGDAYSGAEVILKTTDGGSTWTQQATGVSTASGLRTVVALDANTAWAVGWAGHIYKTTDGGSNWTLQYTEPNSYALRGLAAYDAKIAWIGGDFGRVLRTTDGGATWSPQTVGSSHIQAAIALDANTVYMAGDDGELIGSSSAGASWTTLSSGVASGHHLQSFALGGGSRLWLVGFFGDALVLGQHTGAYGSATSLMQVGALSVDGDRAASFNGTANANVSVPSDSTLVMSGGSYTVEAWVRPTSSTLGQPILDKGDGAAGTADEYQLLYNRSGHPGALSLWTKGTWVNSNTHVVQQGVWSHVAATVSGSSVTFYVNGEPAGTGTAGGSYATTTTNPLQIGKGGGAYFGGDLDEVAVYASALSADRVRAHFKTGSAAKNGVSIQVDPVNLSAPASLPTSRDAHKLVAVPDGRVFVIGCVYCTAVVAYDPTTNLWTSKASLPTGTAHPGVAVAANGKIYIAGGEVAGAPASASNQLLEYDPTNDTAGWVAKTNMPTARRGLELVAAANGKLYAIGGDDFGSPPTDYTTVEEYDPSTNTWATKASMPYGRSFFGAAALGSKIYVAGGGGDKRELLEYDPTANTWARRAPMSSPRSFFPLVAANGKLYAVGGFDGTGATSSIELYDPTADTWTVAATSLGTARWSFSGAIASNGRLYVAGGSGSLSSAESLQLPSLLGSSSGVLRVDFRTTSEVPSSGKLVVDLGAYVTAGGSIPSSPGLLSSSGFTGPSIARSGNQLHITFGSAIPADQPLTLRVSGFGASVAGSPAVDVWTQTSGGTHIDDALGNVVTIAATSVLPTTALLLDSSMSWSSSGTLPASLKGLGVAHGADGRLYAFGGLNGSSSVVNTVSVQDPANPSSTWTTIAPASGSFTGRWLAATVAHPNGLIYVIGGDDSGSATATNKVEAYDPVANAWTTKANLPAARLDLAAAVGGNGKIYAFGGSAGGSGLATIYEYDPAADAWTTKSAALTTATRGLGAAAGANGKIYVTGGYTSGANAFNTLYEYDPWTDTLATKAQMPTARRNLAVTGAPNGRIYAIGGENAGGTTQAATEEYDPDHDTWVTRGNQVAGVTGAAAVARGGLLYYVGGVTTGTLAGSPVSSVGVATVPNVAGLANQTLTVRMTTGDPILFSSGSKIQVDLSSFVAGGATLPPNPGSALGGNSGFTGPVLANGTGGSNRLQMTASAGVGANSSLFFQIAGIDLPVKGGDYPVDVWVETSGGSRTSQTLGILVHIGDPPSFKSATIAPDLSWSSGTSLTTARAFLGVAALDGKVYAVGGTGASTGVDRYDPSTNTWTARTTLNTGRESFALAATGGKLYAMVGWNGSTQINTVEEYDPVANTWAYRASAPTARDNLAVATGANGRVYLFGGYNGTTHVSTVEEYDPKSDTWRTRTSLPGPARARARAVTAANGKIYVIGGYDGASTLNRVDIYDPTTDGWTSGASMPTSRDAFAAVLGSNGKIYAIGGPSASTTVEEYDPTSDAWTSRASLGTGRSDHGAAVVDGRIIVVGGTSGGVTGSVERGWTPGQTASTPAAIKVSFAPNHNMLTGDTVAIDFGSTFTSRGGVLPASFTVTNPSTGGLPGTATVSGTTATLTLSSGIAAGTAVSFGLTASSFTLPTSAGVYPLALRDTRSGSLVQSTRGVALTVREAGLTALSAAVPGGTAGTTQITTLSATAPSTLTSGDTLILKVDSSLSVGVAPTLVGLPTGVTTTTRSGGGGFYGGDNGVAIAANLNGPTGAVQAADGSIYVADFGGNRIRKISTSGTITTFAGTGGACGGGTCGDGGWASTAQIDGPRCLAIGPDGNLYVSEYNTSNHRVRKITLPDGTITTVAGLGTVGSTGDGGLATAAQLNGPQGLGFGPDGSLYIAEANGNRVRRVAPNGFITTVAGTGTATYSGDGSAATSAALSGPAGLAVAADGTIYVADLGNGRIRKVSSNGIIATVAGNGAGCTSLPCGDGGPAVSAQLIPVGLVLAPDGSLYVSDTNRDMVRKVAPSGLISTVAGTGTAGHNGDGQIATATQLDDPTGLAYLSDGRLLIGDRNNHRVRAVGVDGIVRTIAGSGANERIVTLNSGSITSGTPFQIGLRGVTLPSSSGRYKLGLQTAQGLTTAASGTDLVVSKAITAPTSSPNASTTVGASGATYTFGGTLPTIPNGGRVVVDLSPSWANFGGVIPAGPTISSPVNFGTPDAAIGGTRTIAVPFSSGLAANAVTFSLGSLTLPSGAGYYPIGLRAEGVDGTPLAEMVAPFALNIGAGTLSSARVGGDLSWTSRATLPTARSGLGLATGGTGKIYAIGGSTGSASNVVEEYDPVGDSWTNKASMPTARNGLAVVAANSGRIYAIGGLESDGSTYSTKVEEYNPNTNSWTTKASMPTGRQGLAAVLGTNGRIYAIGGHNGSALSTVEEYDPATDTWTTRTALGSARSNLAPAAISGQIYAIGGRNGSNTVVATVDRYDPSSGTTTAVASLPSARENAAAVVSNGRIYLLGGNNGSSQVALATEYNASANAWTGRANLSGARELLGAAVAPDGQLVVAGGLNGSTALGTTQSSAGPSVAGNTAALNVGFTTTNAMSSGDRIEVDLGSAWVANGGGMGATPTVNTTAASIGTPTFTSGTGVISIPLTATLNASTAVSLSISGAGIQLPAAGTRGVTLRTVTAAGGVVDRASGLTLVVFPPPIQGSTLSIANNVTGSSGSASFSFTAPYQLNNNDLAVVRADPAFSFSGATFNPPSGASATAGGSGYFGDGGPAIGAKLSNPSGVAVAADGTLYVADTANNRIRKVDPLGVVRTFAGSGASCGAPTGSCNDGPATGAQLTGPTRLSLAPNGDLYVADKGNNKIRKISSGVVSTVAGTGTATFSGDGGLAAAAALNAPDGEVAFGADGSLYFADTGNRRIRKIDPYGYISTVAGSGSGCTGSSPVSCTGDDGAATAAQLEAPTGLVLTPDGALYIADSGGHRIRKVSQFGSISTIAGDGNATSTGDNALATAATLTTPQGLVLADGALYVSESGGQRVRRIALTGTANITLAAGDGTATFGGDDVTATSAGAGDARGLAYGPDGGIYVATGSTLNTVRKLLPSGRLTTAAGSYAGDVIMRVTSGPITAGSTVTLGINNLTNPSTPLLAKFGVRTATTSAALSSGAAGTSVVGGISSPTLTGVTNGTSGATTSVTISATLPHAVPAGGRIVLPISGAGSTSGVTVSAPSGVTFGSPVQAAHAVVLPVTGGAIASSGGAISFQIDNLVNQAFTGTTSVSLYSEDAAGLKLDQIGSPMTYAVTAAALTGSPSITTSPNVAGTTNPTVIVAFTTTNPVASGGTIEVDLGSAWTVPASLTVGSVTNLAGVTTASATGSIVSVPVPAGGLAASTSVSFTLADAALRLPRVSGNHAATISTKTNAAAVIDQITGVNVAVSVAQISSATIVPSLATAGASTGIAVSFTTINPVPTGGKIVLELGSPLFLGSSLSVTSATNIDSPTAFHNGNNVEVSFAGSIPDGTTVSFTVNGMSNPTTTGSYPLTLHTEASGAARIDEIPTGSPIAYTVTPGTPAALVFTAVPGGATATQAFATSPVVTVRDTYSNTVTTYNGTVTLALSNNPGSGTLSGTTSVSASSGVATFPGLSIEKAGIGYSLDASIASPSLSVVSSGFNVVAGTGTQLAFTTQPGTGQVGSIFAQPTVSILDAGGNVVSSRTDNITVAIASGPSGAVLGGTTSSAATNSVANFTTLKVDRAGTYTLTASADGLSSATSASFTINPAVIGSPSISSSSSLAGRANALTVSFTPNNGIPAGGKIVVELGTAAISGTSVSLTGVSGLIGAAISHSGNNLEITFGSSVASSTAVAFTVNGLTNPGAGTYPLYFHTETSGGARIDEVPNGSPVNLIVNAGALSGLPGVSSSLTAAGSLGPELTVSLTTGIAVPSGGKVEVDLGPVNGNGWTLPAALTVGNVTNFAGVTAATASGTVVSVPVPSGGIAAGTAVSFTLTDGALRLPRVSGSYPVTIRTETSAPLDQITGLSFQVAPATVISPTIVPGTTTAGQADAIAVGFTTNNPVPSGGKVVLDVPSVFTGASPSVSSPTGFTPATVARNGGTVEVSFASSIAAGTTIGFTVNGLSNPTVASASYSLGVHTQDSTGVRIDEIPSGSQIAVAIVADTPTAAQSNVFITGGPAFADGTSAYTVQVTARDQYNNLAVGRTVTVTSSRGGTDTVTPASATTNGSGVATFSVTSTTPGNATLTIASTNTLATPLVGFTTALTAFGQPFPASTGYTQAQLALNLNANASLPAGGRVRVTLPGYAGLGSSTLDSAKSTSGFTKESASGSQIVLAYTGTPSGPLQIVLTGLTNPTATGSQTVTVETRSSTSALVAQTTFNVGFVALEAFTLPDVGSATRSTLSIRLHTGGTGIPAGGRVEVAFPAGFDARYATLITPTVGLPTPLTVTGATSLATIYLPSSTSLPANSDFLLNLDRIGLPASSGSPITVTAFADPSTSTPLSGVFGGGTSGSFTLSLGTAAGTVALSPSTAGATNVTASVTYGPTTPVSLPVGSRIILELPPQIDVSNAAVASGPGTVVEKANGRIAVQLTTGATALSGSPVTFSLSGIGLFGLMPDVYNARLNASDPNGGFTPGWAVNIPIQGAPGQPLNVTAQAGNGQATITWAAPASNGGSAITGYTIKRFPDGTSFVTAGAGATSQMFTGLSNGTGYAFTVTATNAIGSGLPSVLSNLVVPQAPPTITSINPVSGQPPEQPITILGANLAAALRVTFNGTPGTILSTTNSQIVALAPLGVSTGVPISIVVQNSISPSGSVNYTFMSSANATSTAVAATTTARANATSTAQAVVDAVNTRQAAAGASAAAAIALTPLPATQQATINAAGDRLWYRFTPTANRLYRVTTARHGSSPDADTRLWVYPGDPSSGSVAGFFNDDDVTNIGGLGTNTAYSGLLVSSGTSPAASFFVSVGAAANATFDLSIADVTSTIPTPTPRPPTTTPTPSRTPTFTPTRVPTIAADQYDQSGDNTPAQAQPIVVNATGQRHTFHVAGDVDYVQFTAARPGSYSVLASTLTGSAEPVLMLLDATGVPLTDPGTGGVYQARTVLGQALLSFNATTPGTVYVVSASNLDRAVFGNVRGEDVGYTLSVTALDSTATPTLTPTQTATPLPTPTFAPADLHEAAGDGNGSAAGIHPYDLKQPVLHTSAYPAVQGNNGPSHNFHQPNDQDWLAIQLNNIVPGSRLRIATFDLGARPNTILRADTVVALYRADGTTLDAFNNRCSDLTYASCIGRTFSTADAELFKNQTWYVQIKNVAATLYGPDITYSLVVTMDLPDADTAVSITVTPGSSDPPPINEQVDQSTGGTLENTGGTTQVNLPANFSTEDVFLTVEERSVNQSSGGETTFKSISGKAFGTDASSVTEFDRDVGFCVSYSFSQVSGLDQNTIQPRWRDPQTNQVRTDGLLVTARIFATATTDGSLCWRTSHFTEFELSGGDLPTPTPRVSSQQPTSTSTPVPAAPTNTSSATTTSTATATATRTPLPTNTPTPLGSATATSTATPTFAPISTVIPPNATATTVVETSNGALRVSIPPGAVAGGGAVQVDIQVTAAPTAAAAVSRGIKAVQIDMRSNGQKVTQLAQPITIDFAYSDEELAAAGLAEGGLTIYYSSDGVTWTALRTTIDRVNHRVYATVDHLTIFSLAAPRQRIMIPVAAQRTGPSR